MWVSRKQWEMLDRLRWQVERHEDCLDRIEARQYAPPQVDVPRAEHPDAEPRRVCLQAWANAVSEALGLRAKDATPASIVTKKKGAK